MGQAAATFTSEQMGVFRQRRRGGRFCAEVEAVLFEGGDELKMRAVLLSNVSMAGICFQSATPLPVGSVHGIHLDVEYMWLNSHFEVVRCGRRSDGHYEIGGEFIERGEDLADFSGVLGRAGAD